MRITFAGVRPIGVFLSLHFGWSGSEKKQGHPYFGLLTPVHLHGLSSKRGVSSRAKRTYSMIYEAYVARQIGTLDYTLQMYSYP